VNREGEHLVVQIDDREPMRVIMPVLKGLNNFQPFEVDLGDLEPGEHKLTIDITPLPHMAEVIFLQIGTIEVLGQAAESPASLEDE